ncbi:MAG: hypothetical protein ACQET3_03080 [Promethearchaeati archaeon]
MRRPRTVLLGTISLIVMLGFFPLASRANGIFYSLDSEGLECKNGAFRLMLGKDTGPHYRFFDRITNSTEYHLRLIRLFEFQDVNGDGIYSHSSDEILPTPVGLQGGDWVFKGFNYNEVNGSIQSLQFHLNGSSFSPAQSSLRISLRHHIDITNNSVVKFDIGISGWQWTSAENALCLAAIVGSSNRGNDSISTPLTTQQENRISFESAFLTYPPNVTFNSNSAGVNVSLGELPNQGDGQGVLFCFPNFGGDELFYDPTFGLEELSSTTSITSTTPITSTPTPDGGVLGTEQFLILAVGTTVVVGILVLTASRD